MLTTKKLLAPLAAIVGLTAVAFEAQATPAFARQMEMNCMACHNQSLPMLNAFGRQFKLSGFTMAAGNKSMITGGDLGTSVPLAVNAGIGIKANNLTTDKPDTRDTYSVPAGSAIMISGKAAENMGVNTLWNYDGLIHFQGTYSKPVGAGNIGASLYGTQGHGPFIGVESHNTGLHKELAMFDNGPRTNAAQAMGMGLGNGPSSGLVAFYGGSGLKVALGMQTLGYNTIYGNKGLDTDGSSGSLYRVTYDAPAMAGWNLSVGAFGISGTTTGTTAKMFENLPLPYFNDTTATWTKTEVSDHEVTSNGFDLQLQGAIVGMNTQILLTHVADFEFSITDPDTGAVRTYLAKSGVPASVVALDSDLSATSLEMQIMPTAAWGIRLGQMNVSNNKNSAGDYTTTSLGVNYNYADNVRFSLEQSSIDVDTGDDYSETLLQALWAF